MLPPQKWLRKTNMATGKLKVNFKMPTPSAADRMYAKHQAVRKAAGLPGVDNNPDRPNAGKYSSGDSKPVKRVNPVATPSVNEEDITIVKKGSNIKKKISDASYNVFKSHGFVKEEEQLDELSPATKASYVVKAKDQIKQSMPFTKKSDEYRDIAKNFIEKRKKGIAKANEEVEQLDEIGDTPAGRKTLGNYINRSHESGDAARIQATYDKDNFAKHTKTVAKRSSGIAKAVTRLTKESFRIGGMGGRGGGRGNIYMYDRNPGPRDDDDESGHVPYVPKTEHQKKLHKALTDLGNKMKETHPKLREEKDSQEYDYEGDMAKSDLRSIIHNAKTLHDMLDDNTNLAEWCQSKITLAEDYISTVTNYMRSEMNEEVEQIDEKKKLPGLWANIHAKRKRGEAPAKPGDKDYPKTLNIEDANPCWTGYKRKPGTKKFEPGSCVKEGVQDDPKADQMTTDDTKFPKKSRKAAIVKSAAKKMPAEDQFQAKPVLDSQVAQQTNK